MKTHDISVVVQGHVDADQTPACLRSVRTFLPGAEIVLSTWSGTDLSGLGCHKVVLSEDPGCVSADRGDARFNNLNRELTGVRAGLAACTRPHVLKIRSDMVVTGVGFTTHADAGGPRAREYRIFDRRIVTVSLFTRRFVGDGAGRYHTPFHVSDWAHFGLRDDLAALWSAPLVDEPAFSRYFEASDRRLGYAYGTRTWRFPPEQYIFYALVQRHRPRIRMEHLLDYDENLVGESERFVLANFVILDPRTFGMMLNKEPYRTACRDRTALPPGDAEGLYDETIQPAGAGVRPAMDETTP